MIRVLVVDDHDIVRDALASLLGDVSDFQVVGVASSIRDALPLLDSTRQLCRGQYRNIQLTCQDLQVS